MSMQNEWLDELREQWAVLTNQLKCNEVDWKMFESVAKDTFEVLFENREEDFIPKNMLCLILSIHTFGMSSCPEKANTKKEKAAQAVALSFCEQFAYWWDDEMTSTRIGRKFVVKTFDEVQTCYLIDTASFDLSDIVEERGGFTYEDDEDDDFE